MCWRSGLSNLTRRFRRSKVYTVTRASTAISCVQMWQIITARIWCHPALTGQSRRSVLANVSISRHRFIEHFWCRFAVCVATSRKCGRRRELWLTSPIITSLCLLCGHIYQRRTCAPECRSHRRPHRTNQLWFYTPWTTETCQFFVPMKNRREYSAVGLVTSHLRNIIRM